MVLLEAMYYKTVVLTTSNGGANTLIENKKNGFILESMDSKIWAYYIAKIYENKEEKMCICNEAHKKIAEEFTWNDLVKRFIDQYQKLKER